MSLMNCKIYLLLIWSANCAISAANGETKFAIADTKICVTLATLSIYDDVKPLQNKK